MLKEIVIILGAMGCIFLIIPVDWIFYTSGPFSLSMPLILLGFVLAYADFHAIKLLDNNEGHIAGNFLLFLSVAIVFSFIISFEIIRYFPPRFVA